MKLTPARIERTLSQYDARAVPDSHPVMQEFNSLFGEHTFFVDQTGLCIVEPQRRPLTLSPNRGPASSPVSRGCRPATRAEMPEGSPCATEKNTQPR